MVFTLLTGVASDIGNFRDTNQDAAFVAPWGAGVADGVGGGPAGDLASAALVHRLVAGGSRVTDADELVVRIREANWDLGAHVRRDPSLVGMATTFTAVWFTATDSMLLAHTGDSRAYLLRDGELVRQTRDDSYVQALVERGLVREEDAMTHPRRNIITASLRGDESDLVRVVEREARHGDRWLLCSDGVSDYLPDDVIGAVLGEQLRSANDIAESMVALALEAGSRDNVTAVVADVVSGSFVPMSDAAAFAGAAAALFAESPDDFLAV